MIRWIKNLLLSFSLERFESYALAVLSVIAVTGGMFLVGRSTLGEGVISLLYLVPIVWSTARWGQGPGIAAAIAASLAFDFFFIPPFYTFTVGSLEGWLLLGIFLAVAVVIVGRIQSGLTLARAREREATFLYELSSALAGVRTPEAIARVLAGQLQQIFQAERVQVVIETEGKTSSLIINIPQSSGRASARSRPERVIPILAAQKMLGEIRIWRGELPLPPENDRLFQSFAAQGALALERARLEHSQAKAGSLEQPYMR